MTDLPRPEQYAQQLSAKAERIQQQFAEFAPLPLQVFASAPLHYRMRAEFRIWHEGDELFYVMFEQDHQGQKQPVRIAEFAIADQAISQMMQPLLDAIAQQQILAYKLFEVDFLVSRRGEKLVSLLYHRQLDESWQAAATDLAQQFDISLIGRSRGQKRVIGQDFVQETFEVDGRSWHYRQHENSFSQPNASVCQHMLNWASQMAQSYGNPQRDLLELYCGNGNFTLPLSLHYRQVLATEIAKTSIQALHWAIDANQVSNLAIARLSAEDLSSAMRGEREFRRLKDAAINLQDYDIQTIFVDPPRSGIDDDTLKLMAQYDSIIYVSCNPDTLSENMRQLCKSHQIREFALFDQFPYTHHAECAVVLTRHTDSSH